MLKTREQQRDLPLLFKHLAESGAQVAEAEIALARAELAAIVRRYAFGAAIGSLGMAMVFTAVVILAEAGAIALIPVVENPAVAYLIVAAALVVVALVLGLFARHLVLTKHKPVGAIFQWIMGRGTQK